MKGEFLLLRRSDNSRTNPGKWDLPGGKVNLKETLKEAVVREVWEETGISIFPGEIAGEVNFENIFNIYKGKENIVVEATLEALKRVGAKKQFKILSDASKRYFSKQRRHPSTVEEFVDSELEGEFEKLDNRYYDCEPDMNTFLEKYLQTHLIEFVKLV